MSSGGGSDWIAKGIALVIGGVILVQAITSMVTAILDALQRMLWALLTGAGIFVLCIGAVIFIVLAAHWAATRGQEAWLAARLQKEEWSAREVEVELENIRDSMKDKREEMSGHPLIRFLASREIVGLRRQEGRVRLHLARLLPSGPVIDLDPVAFTTTDGGGGSSDESDSRGAPHSTEWSARASARNGRLQSAPPTKSDVDWRLRRSHELKHDWQKEKRYHFGDRIYEQLKPEEQEFWNQIDNYYRQQLSTLFSE